MASMTIRSSYALDPATVHALEELAKLWQVSKSEALRRSIAQAKQTVDDSSPEKKMTPLKLLEAMKKNPAIDQETARRWAAEVREERQAWGEKSA